MSLLSVVTPEDTGSGATNATPRSNHCRLVLMNVSFRGA
jgi:hypothetical protein